MSPNDAESAGESRDGECGVGKGESEEGNKERLNR